MPLYSKLNPISQFEIQFHDVFVKLIAAHQCFTSPQTTGSASPNSKNKSHMLNSSDFQSAFQINLNTFDMNRLYTWLKCVTASGEEKLLQLSCCLVWNCMSKAKCESSTFPNLYINEEFEISMLDLLIDILLKTRGYLV